MIIRSLITNYTGKDSAFYFQNVITLCLIEVEFILNKGKSGAAASLVNDQQIKFYLKKCYFFRNQAISYGGAIFIY